MFQARMAGFASPEQIIGKTDYELPWKEVADSVLETDQRIIHSGVPEELIESGTLFDGSEIISKVLLERRRLRSSGSTKVIKVLNKH